MLMVTLLSMMTFTGCSKAMLEDTPSEEQPENTTETHSVRVKLDMQSGTHSRGVGDPMTDFTKQLEFRGGYIFFTARGGSITNRYEISSSASTDLKNGIINLNDLTDGYNITGVKANSENVYMAGNLPVSVAIAESVEIAEYVASAGNISDVESIILAVGTQNKQDDNAVVSIYGMGGIESTDNPKEKDATLSVGPIAARIEMDKVTGKGNIESFDVEAVYINCYYEQMTLAGYANQDRHFVNNLDTLENYPANELGAGTPYAGLNLHDWHDTPKPSTDKVGRPKDDKAWVYNLLAPTTGERTEDESDKPHIIVRLNNIKLTSDAAAKETYKDPMYLTMRLSTDNTAEIENFTRGLVYQIKNVEFDETNLYDTPEQETIDVNVKIGLVEWVLKPSGVILN